MLFQVFSADGAIVTSVPNFTKQSLAVQHYLIASAVQAGLFFALV